MELLEALLFLGFEFMLTNFGGEHFENSLEFRVVGNILLGVLMSAYVVIFFLNLEFSDFSFVALLFVQFAFDCVQQD